MGGKKQTVTQQSSPWGPSQPYLKDAFKEASQLYKDGSFSADPYQGQRTITPSAATTGSQQGILDMAAGGAPGLDAAKGYLTNAMGGGMYSGMQGVRDNILGSAIPAATAMFSGSGMTNSSTAMDGVGRAATEALAPFEYGAYENAQGRAMQAAGMMPQMEQAAYLPFQMQSQVGAQQDALQAANIDAEMKKYYEGEGQAV